MHTFISYHTKFSKKSRFIGLYKDTVFIFHSDSIFSGLKPVIKQVVTAQPLNARQQVWVPRVLEDDHKKRMTRLLVSVERVKPLTAQWPGVLSIGQNLQSFAGNDDVFIWVKILKWDAKPPTNKKIWLVIALSLILSKTNYSNWRALAADL